MASKRYSIVDKSVCVACGACENICPLSYLKQMGYTNTKNIGGISSYRGKVVK